jgi:nickel superoxide dismutase
MIHQLVSNLDKKFGFEEAQAHCDIPCGIYDPITAQIAAVTVVRMIDLMNDQTGKANEKGLFGQLTDVLQGTAAQDAREFIHTLSRYAAVKEEHAEKAKHEIRIIWGDYIKAQHLEKYPELHGLVHQIMQYGSKSRQTTDRQAALDFVEGINKFTEIFWATKGIQTRRTKSPYNPPLELVYPVLG